MSQGKSWSKRQRAALKAQRVVSPRIRDARLRALQVAAGKYVESIGGMAIVISGAEIMTYPLDAKMNFRICLRVTGRRPPSPVETKAKP